MTAIPWKSPGGRRWERRARGAARAGLPRDAHWRVSGPVGQTIATRSIALCRSNPSASSIDGRVLPAPGAALSRNEPSSQPASRSSARCCHPRRAVTKRWRRPTQARSRAVSARRPDGCRLCRRNGGGQWRKWRRRVNTIAMPGASAAAITSASRTEPPGWMTRRDAGRAASSGPSGNGKNASDASAAALACDRPPSRPRSRPSRRGTSGRRRRRPSRAPSRGRSRSTSRACRHARRKRGRSTPPSVGARFVTTCQSALVLAVASRVLHEQAARRPA